MRLESATQLAPSAWRQTARRALVAAAPARWLLAAGPAATRAVCLTFDDGPDPTGTEAVLDVMQRNGVRGTFFLQGNRVAAHPELVRRMHHDGHDLGHHSWSHSAPATTSASTLAAETIRTRDLIQSLTGVDSSLFRPPHGKLSPAKFCRLLALRQTVVLWTSDPGDVFQPSSEALVAWFAAHPPRPGDIILLHDKVAALAAALPGIIAIVRAQGLAFATISDWLSPAATGATTGAHA